MGTRKHSITPRMTPDEWLKYMFSIPAPIKGEQMALDQLRKQGIVAFGGKHIHIEETNHVDIVAWGCVYIEVKHAKLIKGSFVFRSTQNQIKDGFKAHIVILICEYEDHVTYHYFRADHEAFRINGKIKSSFVFTPGQLEQVKHKETRVKLVQPIMDEHENRWDLVWKMLLKHSEQLKRGA